MNMRMMALHTLFSSIRIRTDKTLLLLGSGLGSLALIVLMNQHVLPLDLPTLIFFSFVLFLFALYRPGWTFLLFIGVLPLESINLAPEALGGIALRPYQWFAGILLLAVGARFVARKLPFRLFRPEWFDLLPVLVALGAFLALLGAPVFALAFKQAFVVASFVALYFLGRIFFRTVFDVRQATSFFLLSSVIVFGYALWQNIRFLAGRESFEVMAGRPNATFGEADWLGLFIVLVLGVVYALLASVLFRSGDEAGRSESIIRHPMRHVKVLLLAAFLTLTLIVLFITVARSAWLGAIVLTAVFLSGLLCSSGVGGIRIGLRKALRFCIVLGVFSLFAAGMVYAFHLSPFQFFNRIQSTGSGLQKITVACYGADTVLARELHDLSELEASGCRHIALEEIEAEQQAGHFIQEVYRPDPNVSIRRQIYGRVFGIMREHPLSGVGWGSAAVFLGADERGAGLNASNVFLEVWLGSGLVGLIAFVTFWGVAAFASFRWYREGAGEERWFALFLLSTLVGLTIFDLFNSGILLGFFFLFLSLLALTLERLGMFRRTDKNTL